MRTKALVIAMLLAVTGATPTLAQDAEPDWQSLPYFRHDYGGWMRIWTNENTFDKGARKTNFTTAFNPYPGPTAEEQTSESQVLWGRCNATRRQTFRTSREIYLPGTPAKLQTSLGAFAAHLRNKASPIDSVELLINGASVHRVTGTKDMPIPFDAAERALVDVTDTPIRYGLNTFTIVGHKKKTRKKAGWCSSTDNYFGVFGEVYGEFLADVDILRSGAPQHSETAYSFKVGAVNLGPSDLIPGAIFSVTVAGESGYINGLEVYDMPGCEAAQPYRNGSKVGLSIRCGPQGRLEPMGRLDPSIIIRWRQDEPVGSKSDVTIGMIGYGENEAPETENNTLTFEVVTVEG